MLGQVDVKQRATTKDHKPTDFSSKWIPLQQTKKLLYTETKNRQLFNKLLTATHRNVTLFEKHSVIINKFPSEMCHRKFITKVL